MNYKNKELAKLIAKFSLEIQKGDKVYIKYKSEESLYLVEQITLEVAKRGGLAYPYKFNKELEDIVQSTYNEENVNGVLERIAFDNQFYDIFVSIGSNDPYIPILKDEVNKSAIGLFKRKKMELEELKKYKRWLLLNYPSIVDAENMGMSYEEYYRYALDAMTYDFTSKLDAIEELRRLIENTEHVKIIGENVDLEFYKNKIPAVSLIGNRNLPDGEVYTSPIKYSANGIIKYNVPSPKNNLIFNNIQLRFCDGKVVDFCCDKYSNEFEEIIDIDEGGRYIGEFALGFNPKVYKPMYDILYDEKLCGSFHIALGNAYEDAFNGNKSALHWDMIYLNQTGNNCDIYFDGKLINSHGNFVPQNIRKLNLK
ncbi:MAG: aminopeptidase [Bacilli bacterium]